MPEEHAADGPARGFDVEHLLHPSLKRDLRELPRLLLGALRLVWAAAPRELVANVVLQAVGSAALALQVLVGKQLLARLLADNASKDFSSVVPSVVVLAVVLAVASVV
ncbi:MAG TPA: hypothetical protein VK425_04780, partial [Acidimicrobiales bacterium]|nr:hypothetical protein [Acidimicrobiales bacterium]